MLKSIRTHGIGLQQFYDIEFGSRMNMFTGDNGLGKTFILELVWWALTGEFIRFPENASYPDPSKMLLEAGYDLDGAEVTYSTRFEPKTLSWKTKARNKIPAEICIYVGSDDSYLVYDGLRKVLIDEQIRELSPSMKQGVEIPSAVYKFNKHKLMHGIQVDSGKKVYCKGLLVDLVDWQIRPLEIRHAPFAYFIDVLRSLSPPDEKLAPGRISRLRFDDVREQPTISFSYGEVPIDLCSASMQRMIGITYLLVWSWYEHIQLCRLTGAHKAAKLTLIIDEIELHLHPKWQRTILKAILDVAKTLNSDMQTQLFTTTHSPLILASTEAFASDETDKLFVFEQEGQNISLRELPWLLEGDASSWLSSEVFKIDKPRSIESQEIIKRAELLMKGKSEESIENLEIELEKLVPASDPFWARWSILKRMKKNDSI